MNLDLNEEQQMLRDTFARFLDQNSSPVRVRAANDAAGFDRALWEGLAELGTFSLRVPEEAGGLGLGTFDAAIIMEQVGRTLGSGPIAETLVAARLLALVGGDAAADVLEQVISGEKVMTIAYHDIAQRPVQWLAGGSSADLVLARRGDDVLLATLTPADRTDEPNLASNGVAEVDLASLQATVLASGGEAIAAFGAAIDEWKLLMAAGLNGLAREAVRLASAYATERKAFGSPIGSFQAISHPLANFIAEIEGGRLFVWKVIYQIAHGDADAAANVPLTLWWAATSAARAAIQSLRTFGGYGLTTEYDVHLYNLRAKAWPLAFGDPARWLHESGRRRYGGEAASLPDVGGVGIDFDLGAEAEELAREVDEFFTATLTPELKAHSHHSFQGHHPFVHKKLAEANLLFPAWPKDRGGRGATPYARHAAGAMWDKHGWTSHAVGTTQMVAAMIDRYGSDDLRENVLKPIMAGEIICSLGFSEPGSGSDVFAAQTKATPEGPEGPDRTWRIDGTKMFTSGANIADYVIMLCRTNPDVPKHKGLTMFIVPLKSEGVEIQPVYTFQDERTNITFYDGVRIPDSYRLGEIDGGLKTMAAALEMEHGGGGFSSEIGALIRAAEELCREIRADDGGALIDDQEARARLSKAWTEFHVAEMLGIQSLWSAQEKRHLPAAGPMAKMFSTDKWVENGSSLIDLTAPLSLSKRKGAPDAVNVSYRFAHGATIWGGTSEIHRSMVAEKVLGLPRSRN